MSGCPSSEGGSLKPLLWPRLRHIVSTEVGETPELKRSIDNQSLSRRTRIQPAEESHLGGGVHHGVAEPGGQRGEGVHGKGEREPCAVLL